MKTKVSSSGPSSGQDKGGTPPSQEGKSWCVRCAMFSSQVMLEWHRIFKGELGSEVNFTYWNIWKFEKKNVWD